MTSHLVALPLPPSRRKALLLTSLLLAGCATVPSGPSVMALPGTGKTFEQFRQDDAACRQFALAQIGGADQAANDAAARDAVVGTVVGALAGAAIGGRDSAGVGAGMGLVVGSSSVAAASHSGSYGSQRQYDHAYIQCMYAKGQRVPVAANFTQNAPATAPNSIPPPPRPGY